MDDPITADFPSRVAVEEEEERAQATAEAFLEPPTIEVLFLSPTILLSATSYSCIIKPLVSALAHAQLFKIVDVYLKIYILLIGSILLKLYLCHCSCKTLTAVSRTVNISLYSGS